MLLLILALLAGSEPAGQHVQMALINPSPEGAPCPETPMSVARKLGNRPPKAIPLTKLPPAQTFMAVDRKIDHCPAPLTMTQYRRGAHR